jgi:hypothetical protein
VKRRALYLAVAVGTFLLAVLIASIWFFPPHVYRLVMQDGVGGPGLGATGKGIGASMKTWKSIDGAEVQEITIAFSSREEAIEDLKEEVKRAEAVIVRGDSRAVMKLGGSVRIVTLEDSSTRLLEAASLEDALSFERARLKVEW